MQTEQTRTARAAFEADGFYLYQQPLIPADVVQGAVDGMDAMRRGEYATGQAPQPSYWNPGDPDDKLVKIEMSQTCDPRIMALVTYPALGKLAAEIMGAKMIQVWWTQLLMKPASNKVATIGWHQDKQYWDAFEDGSELLTAWIACSDVTPASGPMHFVRGSHKWGLRSGGDFLHGKREEIAVPEGETWDEVEGWLPPGGVSFHHNLTLHGSGPNRESFPRRSYALHLRTENSVPKPTHQGKGLVEFLDNLDWCPVIYDAR